MTGMWIVNSKMSLVVAGGTWKDEIDVERERIRQRFKFIYHQTVYNYFNLIYFYVGVASTGWVLPVRVFVWFLFLPWTMHIFCVCLYIFCLPFVHAVMWYQQKYWFSHQKVSITVISYACVQIVQFSEEADNDQVWYKRRSFGWEQVENPTAGACKTSSIYTGKLCICAALFSRFSP